MQSGIEINAANTSDDFVEIMLRNGRVVFLLEVDTANGRALIDINGDFAEHWIPLAILNASATAAEWAAFEGLYLPVARAANDSVAPTRSEPARDSGVAPAGTAEVEQAAGLLELLQRTATPAPSRVLLRLVHDAERVQRGPFARE